jgi:hypothetical protein
VGDKAGNVYANVDSIHARLWDTRWGGFEEEVTVFIPLKFRTIGFMHGQTLMVVQQGEKYVFETLTGADFPGRPYDGFYQWTLDEDEDDEPKGTRADDLGADLLKGAGYE